MDLIEFFVLNMIQCELTPYFIACLLYICLLNFLNIVQEKSLIVASCAHLHLHTSAT